MISWFEKDKRTVVKDSDRPFWFTRVDSLNEAKAFIDECGVRHSMCAFNESYYAAYSLSGEWIIVERSK